MSLKKENTVCTTALEKNGCTLCMTLENTLHTPCKKTLYFLYGYRKKIYIWEEVNSRMTAA